MKKIMLIILILLPSLSFTQNWEFVGLDSMMINSLQVKGDTIWAGTRDVSINDNSGLYLSIEQGNGWKKIDSSLGTGPVGSITIDETNSAIIYIIKGGDIFKTTNNGLLWSALSSQLGVKVKQFIVSPLDTSEYYVVINTIGHEWSILQLFYRSTNSGETWEYECCPGNQEFGMIMNFTIDNTDPNVLYISAASNTEFISRSTDRGENWETLSGQPPSIIFSDAFIQNRLYLFRYQNNSFSDDGGYTWQIMQGEFSADAIFISFYQDKIYSTIYILMNEGLFYSRNDSIYWKLIPGSDDLPLDFPSYYSYNINSISIDHENNYTYVGTNNGIYRIGIVTSVDETGSNETIINYTLEQNYPNPFNPSTTISFQIPENGFVTLKIYDAIGNEVATLVNENKQSGSYEVSFEAKNLTSGVYYYRLQAGSYIETKKMLFLK